MAYRIVEITRDFKRRLYGPTPVRVRITVRADDSRAPLESGGSFVVTVRPWDAPSSLAEFAPLHEPPATPAP